MKTFIPGGRTCSVGMKAAKDFGENFVWVLGRIPTSDTSVDFEYYIIPAPVMAKNVAEAHERWLVSPGAKGQAHSDSKVRTVYLPPFLPDGAWDTSEYRNQWRLIERKLDAQSPETVGGCAC